MDTDLQRFIKEFIKRTGNEEMAVLICACCAGQVEAMKISKLDLTSIPNGELLVPTNPHPKHNLFHDMLLEPRGVDMSENSANICDECLLDLHRKRLPSTALANELWIG